MADRPPIQIPKGVNRDLLRVAVGERLSSLLFKEDFLLTNLGQTLFKDYIEDTCKILVDVLEIKKHPEKHNGVKAAKDLAWEKLGQVLGVQTWFAKLQSDLGQKERLQGLWEELTKHRA